MTVLRIKDPKTLAEIEEAISLIRSHPEIPIQFPKDSYSKRRGALHDASRIQLITTWARHAPDSFLHFNDQNDAQTVVSALADYAPGIAALRLSKGIKVGEEFISRREALIPAIEKMKETDQGNFEAILKGRTIDLICVSGAEIQYLKPLFFAREKNAVRGKAEMQQFAKRINGLINKNDSDLVPESLIKALGIFTHELFLNTQEHATSDFDGKPYPAHIEGMIVSWKLLEENQFTEDFSGHPKLNDFWLRELSVSGNTTFTETLRCLEISYFDSGPGYVSRATGIDTKQISLEEETRVLMSCLGKNTTSKNQTGAGLGLPTVLAELRDIGGLIRIRSGRKAIFNVFSQKDTDTNLYDFHDWTTEKLDSVEGVVVSILIPLRKN